MRIGPSCDAFLTHTWAFSEGFEQTVEFGGRRLPYAPREDARGERKRTGARRAKKTSGDEGHRLAKGGKDNRGG